MSKNDIPYEDACCVVGYTKDNAPIWKRVGIKMKTKSSGRDVILLDRTFNPAGVQVTDNTKNSVPIYFFTPDEYRKDETQDKRGKQKRQQEPDIMSEFEDDIPF